MFDRDAFLVVNMLALHLKYLEQIVLTFLDCVTCLVLSILISDNNLRGFSENFRIICKPVLPSAITSGGVYNFKIVCCIGNPELVWHSSSGALRAMTDYVGLGQWSSYQDTIAVAQTLAQ